MSKIRKQSREKHEGSELFSDDDFDTDDFVDQMEEKLSHHRMDARSGWRRIEELREERALRSQLVDLEDWDEFGAN